MPRKMKIEAGEIAELVRQHLAGEIGVNEAGRQAGVDKKTMRRWIARYESEGIDGLLPQRKNRVYSLELKLEAARSYLAGDGSLLDICKKYKIKQESILRQWIKVYTVHGDFNSVKFSGGGSYMRQGRDTTQEERIQIAKECYASGKNYGEMAIRYNVSYQQVRTWTLRYEELGEAGLEDRRGRRKKDQAPRTELEKAQIEIERLKHELHKAEMERDLLKKLDEVLRRDAYRK